MTTNDTIAVATAPGVETTHRELTDVEQSELETRRDANTPTLTELKTQRKQEIKREARQVLQDTDWYIVRKQEQGIRGLTQDSIPATVKHHRDAVRSLEGQAMDEIGAADTKDRVRSVTVDWPDPPEPPL